MPGKSGGSSGNGGIMPPRIIGGNKPGGAS